MAITKTLSEIGSNTFPNRLSQENFLARKPSKKSEIPELLKSDSSELIVTMGAGDIGDEVELIKKTLAENL